MQLHNPLGLLGLLSIPVLLWLWRLSATRKEFLIASLIPFEHLLPRPPQRRSRLLINLLFWIQLAALTIATLALAQPVISRQPDKITLVVLDTSASMYGHDGGISALSLAKRRLNQWLMNKPETEQVFLMTSVPPAPLLPQPHADKATLVQALKRAQGTHLSGNLASAVRAGSALLRRRPDKVLVVTDESRPVALEKEVEWMGVGRLLSNMGIVAVSIEGTFCSPAQATVLVTVQNFSESGSPARVAATIYGVKAADTIAETSTTLPPWGRQTLSLSLPIQKASDLVQLTLYGDNDHFELDKRVWLYPPTPSRSSVLLQVESPSLKGTFSKWLDACPAIDWHSPSFAGSPGRKPGEEGEAKVASERFRPTGVQQETRASARGAPQPKEDTASSVVISDHGNLATDLAALIVRLPVVPKPILSYWVTSLAHPISAYLPPIGFLAAPISTVEAEVTEASEVVSALFNGMRVPVVVAEERAGIRRVHFFFDPSKNIDSTLSTLLFFNSLRWLTNEMQIKTIGDPLVLSAFRAGSVQVQTPDNRYDSVDSINGKLHYDKTTLTGFYTFSQAGRRSIRVPVNLLNPTESNLIRSPSTWQSLPSEKGDPASSSPIPYPLATLLAGLVLLLLLLEWSLHAWRNRKHPKSPGPPFAIAGAGKI